MHEPRGGAESAAYRPDPTRRPAVRRRGSLVFALVGLVLALVAGGIYVFNAQVKPPQRSPEETVQEFLSAVFLAASPDRVRQVACASWDPSDAIERTSGEIEDGVSVSWGELQVASKSEDRVTVRAKLGLRQRDDPRPSSFQQWRFNLVDEDGWRVCDARPFNV